MGSEAMSTLHLVLALSRFRHPGESRGPAFRWLAARDWIPAFAGMTGVAAMGTTSWEVKR